MIQSCDRGLLVLRSVEHCVVFALSVVSVVVEDARVLSRQGNQAFREAMAKLENQPRVRGLSFTSFLILPFQRITRLKLLVQVSAPKR